jgi:hypothetical protein
MSTSSWLDLLMNSLGQHLWKYQHWRENIIVKVFIHISLFIYMFKLLEHCYFFTFYLCTIYVKIYVKFLSFVLFY